MGTFIILKIFHKSSQKRMERSSLSPLIPNSRHADPEGGQEGSSPKFHMHINKEEVEVWTTLFLYQNPNVNGQGPHLSQIPGSSYSRCVYVHVMNCFPKNK